MSTAKQIYSDLLRHMPGGCLVTTNGVVVATNPDAVDTMGIPNGRLLGVPLENLLLPEFEQQCRKLLEDADDKTSYVQVRLARRATPIELAARSLEEGTVSVGVRSLLQESYYSAAAKGDLTHDQVTGLPNRYYVLSELERHFRTTMKRPTSIVAIWIDDLEALDESNGGPVGDQILTEVAKRLETKLRGPDLLGRFDNTGFVTVLRSDVDINQLAEIGDRLRDEIAFPVQLNDKLISFTTSLAIGNIESETPSIGRVMALLEAAANRAKTSGGDRTEVVKL